ncbi:MAG: hypothetical protein ABIB71_04040 [Candidatus Woesearchaeota archaeon]
MVLSIKEAAVLKLCSDEGIPNQGFSEIINKTTSVETSEEELNRILSKFEEKGFASKEDGRWYTTDVGDKELDTFLKDETSKQSLEEAMAVQLKGIELEVLKSCNEFEPKEDFPELKAEKEDIDSTLKRLASKGLAIKTEKGWWRTADGKDCVSGVRKVKVLQ